MSYYHKTISKQSKETVEKTGMSAWFLVLIEITSFFTIYSLSKKLKLRCLLKIPCNICV